MNAQVNTGNTHSSTDSRIKTKGWILQNDL